MNIIDLSFLTKCLVSLWLLLIAGSFSVYALDGYPQPGLLPNPVTSPEVYADGQKYYVAAVATNGDGSFASPFNDIQTAIDQAQAGDVVFVMPGTYPRSTRIATVRDGTADRRICLMAYDPNNRPVLRRSLVNNQGESGEYGGELLLIKNRYFLVDGFVFDGEYTSDTYYHKYKDGPYPYEVSYLNIIAIAHYGRGQADEPSREFYAYNYDGDYAIVRNCEIRRNRSDCVYVSADHTLIENSEVHHCLRGVHDLVNPNNNHQVDAHGIIATHATELTVRNCELHHFSGDCFQIDPDVPNRSQTKLWDDVLIEHTKMWTATLTQDEADFDAGTNPGENGIDTKTYHNEPMTHRPKMTVRNVEVHGFSQDGENLISNRSVFNVKYRVDWLIDGVRAYNNQFVFRVRGEWENELQGNVNLTLMNALVYDNHQGAFRAERHVQNLHIYNSTFANNAAVMVHADSPDEFGYDVNTFEMRNSLFFGSLPSEAADSSNRIASTTDFVSQLTNDYHLVEDSGAVDTGIALLEVTHDLDGYLRPLLDEWDVGAYEYGSDFIFADDFEGGDTSAWRSDP